MDADNANIIPFSQINVCCFICCCCCFSKKLSKKNTGIMLHKILRLALSGIVDTTRGCSSSFSKVRCYTGRQRSRCLLSLILLSYPYRPALEMKGCFYCNEVDANTTLREDQNRTKYPLPFCISLSQKL